jgi:hypothetical protein
MNFTKNVMLLLTLCFALPALAAPPTYRICNGQSELDSFRTPLIGCSHAVSVKKSTGWNKIDVELVDPATGSVDVKSVRSTYVVSCSANQLCKVEWSDTLRTGGLMGHSPEGRYLLDYDYYIDYDAAGNATEYLRGTGPQFGGERVSAAVQPTAAVSQVTVFEASCAPQMDDECTINNKRVPKAQLGNYLPKVNEADVEAAGGACEYPICYDAQYKPVGIRAE